MKKPDQNQEPTLRSAAATPPEPRRTDSHAETATPPSRVRLESWKQIADYLHCSERTARRYLDKGMPLYRIAALDHQRVFAYADELDHWLHEGQTVLPSIEEESLQMANRKAAAGSDPGPLPAPEKPAGSSSETQLRLQVIEGQDRGNSYLMRSPSIVFGREGTASFILSDLRISRRHAQIRRQGNEFLLEDLGSRNGTALNGKPVLLPAVLRHNDRIVLGGAVIIQICLISAGETIEAGG